MSHATSMRLARLVKRIHDRRLLRERQTAALNGWQVEHVAGSTYRFRDPRFDQLATRSPARAGEHHG